jgi:hypothetical protein
MHILRSDVTMDDHAAQHAELEHDLMHKLGIEFGRW